MRLRLLPVALLLLGRLAEAQSADGIVKLRESALNEMAAALLPIPFAQTVRPLVPIPFGSAPLDLPGCDEVARGNLTALSFRIRPSLMSVGGSASGTWCGLSWTAAASANGQVVHDAAARTVRMAFGSGVAQTTVTLPLWFVVLARIHFFFVPESLTLAIPIDLSRTLGSIPPIPLQAAELTVETARGPRAFALVGRDVQVLTQDGFIELRGNVVLR